MIENYDKPQYINVKRNDILDTEKESKTIELIRKMIANESFGVLATKGENECYTSLISFTISSDLKTLVFATPIETKKFQMIKDNKNVSVLIDNRSDRQNSINDIVAITILGQAKLVKDKDKIAKCSKLLTDKHSYLDEFIRAKTTAIITVEISSYDYVTSFQEVIRWTTK